MLISRKFRLARARMLLLLDELAAMQGGAFSLYVPRRMPPAAVSELLQGAWSPDLVPPDIVDIVDGSETGAVLFWGLPRKYLLLPPFPVEESHTADGYDTAPLRALLSSEFVIGLVLVRLGAYSVGVSRGTTLLTTKTGTGLVHARHKKGGSSQARFARHREKQIGTFLDRVCGHVREQIEPHARSLDYLVYGGARNTITSLQKRCPFLHQFDGRVLRLLLDIPDPRRSVLERAVSDIWSTAVIEWQEAGQ